jgi:hypothetical protein
VTVKDVDIFPKYLVNRLLSGERAGPVRTRRVGGNGRVSFAGYAYPIRVWPAGDRRLVRIVRFGDELVVLCRCVQECRAHRVIPIYSVGIFDVVWVGTVR